MYIQKAWRRVPTTWSVYWVNSDFFGVGEGGGQDMPNVYQILSEDVFQLPRIEKFCLTSIISLQLNKADMTPQRNVIHKLNPSIKLSSHRGEIPDLSNCYGLRISIGEPLTIGFRGTLNRESNPEPSDDRRVPHQCLGEGCF